MFMSFEFVYGLVFGLEYFNEDETSGFIIVLHLGLFRIIFENPITTKDNQDEYAFL